MKTVVLVVLLAIVALGAIYIIFQQPAYPMNENDAKKFFLEDLREKYPNADIREIMDITQLTSSDGSSYYQLKARVTNGEGTPCPERIHVYYDYPPKNYVSQPPEYITKSCKVCINEPHCILAFTEEAIIASHTYNGTGEIEKFIKDNSDAAATASAMDSYGNYTGVWLVKWSSPSSALSYTAVLSKTQNTVLEIIKESN